MGSLSLIKILGHLVLMKKHKMPTDWKQPLGDPATLHYATDALQMGDRMPPPISNPFNPFIPENAQSYHHDSTNEVGQAYLDFHDDVLDAVKFSHDMWKLQAKIKDLKVMALAAIGTPGCLDGPELESNIKNAPSVAKYTDDNAKKHVEAVAKGVSTKFKEWQDKVMVPGLPWYPAFVAFPGPMAPPMPNVPMPLIVCPSAKLPSITVPDELKGAMVDEHDQGLKDEDPDKFHETLYEAIGTVLSLGFLIWMASQNAMLVLGKGPIPTFAPPYVPVGPVVNGDNIAAPGHFMA